MDEIIKVNYENGQPTVSARDLHEGLDIKSNFTTWFDRMCEYGFTENDYKKCFPNLESGCNGGQNMVDYQITVDMAKQICMIQRSEKGRQYRTYFLELEKAWNTPEQIMARALEIARKTIDDMKRENATLVEDNQAMKPKAEYFDELVDRNLLTSFRTTANEFGIKESVLISWLIEKKYIYRDQKNVLRPYSTTKDTGLFETKEYKSRHSEHAGTQTLITPKGRETFRILMKI